MVAMDSQSGNESIALRDSEDAWEEIYDEPLQTYMGGVANHYYKYAGHIGLGRPLFAWLKQDQARLSLPKTPASGRSKTPSEVPSEYHFGASSSIARQLASPDSTRFLQILPGSEMIVECRLHAAKVQDMSDRFEALSYASRKAVHWGSFQPVELLTEKIIVNGTTADCRQDLAQLLRRLRLRERSRIIWCPHLCVDLNSVQERNSHTKMASQIYEAAHHVIVWLGEDSFKEPGKACASICKVSNVWRSQRGLLKDVEEAVYYFNPEPSPFGGQPTKPPSPSLEEAWSTLIRFFYNPWFSSIWSLLEVSTAKDVSVMIGDGEIRWEWVGICACILRENYCRLPDFWHRTWKRGKEPTVPHHILHAALLYRLSRSQCYWPPSKLRLDQLLPLTAQFHWRSDQDRVFSLLGIVLDSDRLREKIPINYDRSIAQVREDMAKGLLDFGHTQILSRIQHDHGNRQMKPGTFDPRCLSLEGPSWTPQKAICLHEPLLPIDPCPDFFASGGLEPVWLPMLKGSTLTASTVIIDQIKSDSRLDRYDTWWRGAGARGPNRNGEETPSLPRAPGAFGDLMSQYDLEALQDDILPHITEGDLQRMAVTLTCGKDWYGCPVSDISRHTADYARCILRQAMRWSLRWAVALRERSSSCDSEPCITQDDLLRISKGGHADRFLDAAASVGYGRCLFETEKGLIGMGPDVLTKGDQLCVILGLDVPFVIRPLSGGYHHLIGECYVHNMMHGEASESLRSGVDGLEESAICLI